MVDSSKRWADFSDHPVADLSQYLVHHDSVQKARLLHKTIDVS